MEEGRQNLEKDRGIREIVKYGIAFAGKNVEIAIG